MNALGIANPFGAPVYHEETVTSTMDAARRLADGDAPHGTVITADFQEAGRGRGRGRPWNMDRGRNLPFTLLLRYDGFAAVPPALTLRTGLAAALAIEAFAPSLAGLLRIKWPNDLMAPVAGQYRKIAGILTEGDGKRVFIGIGVNVAQTAFPDDLRTKAGSIALALGAGGQAADTQAAVALAAESLAAARFTLLEKILAGIYRELEARPGPANSAQESWRARLDERLFMKGQQVSFIPGGPDSGQSVEGTLLGIGLAGEILLLPDGEKNPRSFITGELRVYA
ncbi:MAG: biotin--[acetyl-CoA-carboxylase] ligase [Treponema sp.]|jgi:BirA family biotin operon repressor/biotin-[acetyl-CoA-carboxylase] ligase|nr:biotin--[acetyl-CoA-carboxylase] ligase [Treponema sp.]